MPQNNIIETIGNTPIVELKKLSPSKNVRVFAKLEGANPTGSVKDRIAKRSEEHTSELQSLVKLVCRLLLEQTKS